MPGIEPGHFACKPDALPLNHGPTLGRVGIVIPTLPHPNVKILLYIYGGWLNAVTLQEITLEENTYSILDHCYLKR